jgi:hypothetical protein
MLERESGCDIEIDTDTLPPTIAVRGPSSKIDEALQMIEDTIWNVHDIRRKVRLSAAAKQPKALILGPTHELASQIADEAKKYRKASGFVTYEGESKMRKDLKIHSEVVVATPGRCIDLNNSGALDLSKLEYFVLDEADRMLDMGFGPQIRQILNSIPSTRQSLLFSATWPKELQDLAKEFLNNPVHVTVGETNVLNANPHTPSHPQGDRSGPGDSPSISGLFGVKRGRENSRDNYGRFSEAHRNGHRDVDRISSGTHGGERLGHSRRTYPRGTHDLKKKTKNQEALSELFKLVDGAN